MVSIQSLTEFATDIYPDFDVDTAEKPEVLYYALESNKEKKRYPSILARDLDIRLLKA